MREFILTLFISITSFVSLYGQSPAFIEQVAEKHPLYNLTSQQRFSVVHQMQMKTFSNNDFDSVVNQFQIGDGNVSNITSMYGNDLVYTFQYGSNNTIDATLRSERTSRVGLTQIGFNHNIYIDTNQSITVKQFGSDTNIIIETY